MAEEDLIDISGTTFYEDWRCLRCKADAESHERVDDGLIRCRQKGNDG